MSIELFEACSMQNDLKMNNPPHITKKRRRETKICFAYIFYMHSHICIYVVYSPHYVDDEIKKRRLLIFVNGLISLDDETTLNSGRMSKLIGYSKIIEENCLFIEQKKRISNKEFRSFRHGIVLNRIYFIC